MTLERPPIDNTLARSERPETSKFSRSSRRTEFQATLTDMGSNFDIYNKAHHPPNKKGDTQTKFYSTKTKFPKTQSFSSTFYPSEKNSSQKNRNDHQRDTAAGSDRFPGTHESEILDNSPSTMNFRLSNGDFKQGTTLDKVLGAQFKKIDIFDANIKEFDKQGSLNDHGIDEKTDEASEVEEKEYQYESFEILETDDEEDTVSEINQEKEKDGIRSSQFRDIGAIQENHEVLSRIQNKYKSSKPKFLPKTKPKGLRSRSPLKEKVEEINTENASTERSEMEYRRDRGSSTRTESKSSSPKFGANYSAKFPSFVGLAFDGNNNHHQQVYNTDNTPIGSGDALAFKELVKNSSSPGHFHQSQTSFRGTSTNFQATNENFRTTNEKFRSSFMKKTFYNNGKAMTQVNPTLTGFPDQNPDYEREKTGTRSNSLASSMKHPENVGGKFQPEKLTGAALEQKFLRENKMMTQKIMKGEKELMEKYAKMFKLNQKEMNLVGGGERRYEGSKRLSTPLKDFSQSRNFQKRKIINL